MRQIDIVMTAALRPEILEATLSSLEKNLAHCGWEFRLVVDIAPVGDKQHKQKDVAAVAQKFFPPDRLVVRTLADSIQAEALKWTWDTSKSPYILQWEDDWVLEKPVMVNDLLYSFIQNPKLGMLYLDRAGKSVTDYARLQTVCAKLDKSTWKRHSGKSLGGPPAMLRREYANAVCSILDGVTCLDILSSSVEAQEILSFWEIFIYTGRDGKGNLVKDIGKQWRKERGIGMVKKTKRGVTWIRK